MNFSSSLVIIKSSVVTNKKGVPSQRPDVAQGAKGFFKICKASYSFMASYATGPNALLI